MNKKWITYFRKKIKYEISQRRVDRFIRDSIMVVLIVLVLLFLARLCSKFGFFSFTMDSNYFVFSSILSFLAFSTLNLNERHCFFNSG